jgi:octopine oxidase subunit B
MPTPESSSREVDFAIVGGGIVGMAIAWGLVLLGRRVAVLDEGDLEFRASRGNFAHVAGAGCGS